ncbi:MAG TPA: molybdopterin molybdenumtransferase MoeA, partial [Rhodobacter sp.]|nr:molybdopterin molybdenumtransferase MoeA [Rhodobacter sp.]
PRAHYMRATITHEGATAIAHIAADQDSALLSVLTGANALVIAPSNGPALPPNSLVPYLSL